MALAAVVVAHHDDLNLANTLAAVDAQQLLPEHKYLVAATRPSDLPSDWLFLAHEVERSGSEGIDDGIDADVLALTIQALSSQGNDTADFWLWPLTAGSIPDETATRHLMGRFEATPSAAQIGVKLVDAENLRVIRSLGITLTRSGQLFTPVSGEFDQSQHDDTDDVLGAQLNGSLLRISSYLEVGGLSAALPRDAQALELGIRLRLAGFRTVVATSARVALPTGNSATTGSATSKLRASQAIRFLLLPTAIAVLYALVQPVWSLLLTFWLVLLKQPESIGPRWAAGFGTFFTVGRLLGARRALANASPAAIRRLSALYASPEEVNRANRSKFQASEALSTSSARALTASSRPRFVASGGLWLLLLVLLLSVRLWPTDIAVTGGGLLPLAGDWVSLFNRAGSSWQLLSGGFPAPSDPFNWVLLTLGSVTAWQPSLGTGVFLVLSKPLAFLGTWRALSLVSARPMALALGALAYAFWPALNSAALEGRLGTTVALVGLPFLVYTLSRLLQLGQGAEGRTAAWTWLACSALLAAAIGAGAPSLAPVLAVVILVLGIYRWRRLGYLIWLPVPLAVLWAPLAFYLTVGLGHPLALLIDPGVPLTSRASEFWQLLLGGQPRLDLPTLGAALVMIVALFATLTKRALTATALWLLALVALAAGWLLGQIQYVNNSPVGAAPNFVAGSTTALGGLAGLALVVAATIAIGAAIESGPRFWAAIVVLAGLTANAGLAAGFLTGESLVRYTDGRQVPAVVQASSATGLRQLTIGAVPDSPNGFRASVTPPLGVHLEDLSVAARVALPTLLTGDSKAAETGKRVSALAADLISANGSDLNTALSQLNIGFVLVPAQASSAELVGALDSVQELEPVGITEFGRLWRVRDAQTQPQGNGYPLWSITKGVQFLTLVLFALLAIPTRRSGKNLLTDDLSDIDDLSDFEDEFANQERS